MFDVARRAMELEEYYVQKEALENPIKLYNTTGQIRIFKYIIDKSLVPSEKEKELRVMYDDALQNFFNETTDDEIHKILKLETEGAADAIAWVLEIPKEIHNQNKDAGKVV